MTVIAQTVLCNRAHSVDQRMARWLLMTHDRVKHATFPITQEFLGKMLGVQRPAVNLAGRKLQGAGIIRYSRGRLTVLDRVKLELAACECHGAMAVLMQSVRLPRRTQ
jgi:CRP-like cAMP-binding protein